MLMHTSETDFHELRWVARDRLSPDAISYFFIALFLGSGIFTVVVTGGASNNSYVNHLFWDKFSVVYITLLTLHLLIALFFLIGKIAFKFQRTQSIFLSVLSFKFSVEMYVFYFLICDDRNAPNYMYITGAVALLGGGIYLVISSVRGIRRVQQGHFRKGGKGLYNFQESKGYVSLPIIFAATTIGGNLARLVSDDAFDSSRMMVIYGALFFAMALQYLIAMVWPEFLLLAYCKFRFASFRISAPERIRKHQEIFQGLPTLLV